MKKIEHISKNIIYYLFFLIIALLTVLSVFVTVFVTRDEDLVFSSGYWYWQLAVIAGVVLLIALIAKKNINIRKISDKKAILVLLGINVLISFMWIWNTRLYPTADQESVLKVANDLINADYSEWNEKGYMFFYPFQNGIVMYLYGLCKIFPVNQHFAIQLINVIFYAVGILFFILDIQKLFKEDGIVIKSLILVSIWLPFSMYNTFIYGSIAGFTFSVMALYFILSFFEKRTVVKMLLASVFMALAVIVKSNYSILLIAFVILILTEYLKSKKIMNFIFVLLIIAAYILSRKGIDYATESMINKNVTSGIPKIAWVAMGISGEYGWWDGYNMYVYGRCNYDEALTKEASMERINLRISQFAKNPLSFGKFFAGKIVSQWCEPTFQSRCIQNNRKSSIELSSFIKSFMDDEGAVSDIYCFIYDMLQSLIYFGTLLYLWFERKEITIDKLILGVCFIGGFLFHLVWEAKGQYTIVYFYLIIPYAVLGFVRLYKYLKKVER